MESVGTGPSHRGRSSLADHLDKHGWLLATSRVNSSAALSLLAAYQESRSISATMSLQVIQSSTKFQSVLLLLPPGYKEDLGLLS